MVTVTEALEIGARQHQLGNLAEAEQTYRQILAVEPQNADALHLLGSLAIEGGQLPEAIRLISLAIRFKGAEPNYHVTLGEAYRRLGDFAQSVRCYQQAIKLAPLLVAAHANLGLMHRQQGHWSEAVQCFRNAVELASQDPRMHAILAAILQAQGRFDDAAASYRSATELNPRDPEMRNGLGMVLHSLGRPAEAESHYREAIKLEPNHIAANCNLGMVLADLGRHEEAVRQCQRAIEINSLVAAVHCNLAGSLEALGRAEESVAASRRAIDLDPGLAAAHSNLSIALQKLGRFDEAIAAGQAAVRAAPQDARMHSNLASALQAAGNLEDAVARFRGALELDPNHAVAHNNLGLVLQQLGRPAEAESHFRRAIEARRGYAIAYSNLGAVLAELGRHDEAIVQLRSAIELDTGIAPAHCNLVTALQNVGQPDEALTAARQTVELLPEYATGHANLAGCLQRIGRAEEAIEAFRTAVRLDPTNWQTHSSLLYALNYHPAYDPAEIFAEHREWGRRHADPRTATSLPHTNDRTPGRRLRVGYVSAHFRTHAVNFFSEPILASHDHAVFEVFCYSDVAQEDATTERLKTYADAWRNIVGSSQEEVSELVRRDEIDILVDLTGHIAGCRLPMFALKPAPVQVTYLGYQNTTGMAAMDYRLTDAWADPPGKTDAYYSEELVRLPGTFFCYQPPSDAPGVSAVPALANGYTTFGSFNNFRKVTTEVLDTWARILLAVPRSRLLLLSVVSNSSREAVSPWLREHVVGRFERQGVSGERIEICPQRPLGEYLELVARADIALDSFPFNGHTTTCDSLWMGVPVVMRVGETYVSRYGGTALVNLGLDDLIARTNDEYVEIAVQLAGDQERLQQLRDSLRGAMLVSPILDALRFTRDLEIAYRQMWTSWCSRSPLSY